jgi:hypothetical protein
VETWSDTSFAAYLAGFTDGEGYMDAPPHGGLRIILANCERDVLEAIRRRLGYGVIRSQQQKPHWRERFVLVISSAADCESFARLTLPYLIIKRRPALAILAKCEEWRNVVASYEERNHLIREAIAAGEVQKEIAARFGLSQQAISRIKLGHTWPSEKPKSARQGARGASLRGRVRQHWSSSPGRGLNGTDRRPQVAEESTQPQEPQ